MGRVQVAVVVVCAGLALAGCGAKTQPAGQSPVSTEVVSTQSAVSASLAPPVKPVVRVPEQLRFTAKTVDGKDFVGESLAGRPAMLWFWTPWCPKCQGEAEDIAAAVKETGGSVQFVGVAAHDQVPAMQKFVERYGLGSFPHIADTDAAVWKRFGVVEQPAHAFIKADGTIEMVLKQLPADQLLDKVRALVS